MQSSHRELPGPTGVWGSHWELPGPAGVWGSHRELPGPAGHTGSCQDLQLWGSLRIPQQCPLLAVSAHICRVAVGQVAVGQVAVGRAGRPYTLPSILAIHQLQGMMMRQMTLPPW